MIRLGDQTKVYKLLQNWSILVHLYHISVDYCSTIKQATYKVNIKTKLNKSWDFNIHQILIASHHLYIITVSREMNGDGADTATFKKTIRILDDEICFSDKFKYASRSFYC